jgi:Lon protease-like protein
MIDPLKLPIFPLNTVLFPGGSLPLRVFEARYMDMAKACLSAGTGLACVRSPLAMKLVVKPFMNM